MQSSDAEQAEPQPNQAEFDRLLFAAEGYRVIASDGAPLGRLGGFRGD
jgi:hypothetical protein